jgi:hypothetical protein
MRNTATGAIVSVVLDLSDLDRAMIMAGGKLAAIKQKQVHA